MSFIIIPERRMNCCGMLGSAASCLDHSRWRHGGLHWAGRNALRHLAQAKAEDKAQLCSAIRKFGQAPGRPVGHSSLSQGFMILKTICQAFVRPVVIIQELIHYLWLSLSTGFFLVSLILRSYTIVPSWTRFRDLCHFWCLRNSSLAVIKWIWIRIESSSWIRILIVKFFRN